MIAVQDMVYARFQAPDLDVIDEFMQSFGLLPSARVDQAIYLRGYGPGHHIYVAEKGPEARCLGFALAAKSSDDLRQFSADAGAPVEKINEPGGGERVVVTDPDGFRVEIVHGVEALPSETTPATLALNQAGLRHRLNDVVRPPYGPSHVLRLGHVALAVKNLDASVDFYSQLFGMKVADSYFMGDESNRVAAFLRCSLGEKYTDHHTIALVQAQEPPPRPTVDHVSFEVLNWDDLMIGHQYLSRATKYKHNWGIGRHVDGSNLFDYWRDPFGVKVEHFTDIDAVNDHYVSAHSRFDPKDPGRQLSVWGPPVGPDFFA